MNTLFNKIPDIISKAAQSGLGIFALMIIGLTLLGYFFFAPPDTPVKIKLTVFILFFLGVVSFGFAIVRTISTVPNVEGLEYETAVSKIEATGFIVNRRDKESETHSEGTVISQSPRAGEKYPEGRTIYLTIAKEPKPTVPHVEGRLHYDAERVLTSVGFRVIKQSRETNHYDEGTVIEQSPMAGTQQSKGTTVYLTVATTPIPTFDPITYRLESKDIRLDGYPQWADFCRPEKCQTLIHLRSPRYLSYEVPELRPRRIVHARIELTAAADDHPEFPLPYCIDLTINGTTVVTGAKLLGMGHLPDKHPQNLFEHFVKDFPVKVPENHLGTIKEGFNEIGFEMTCPANGHFIAIQKAVLVIEAR